MTMTSAAAAPAMIDMLVLTNPDRSTASYQIDSRRMNEEVEINPARFGIDRRAVFPTTRQQLLIAVTRGGMPLRAAVMEDLVAEWFLVENDPVILAASHGKTIRMVWLL